MISNPILPGFHPDPCICRKGNDYYLTVSSFEWLPGLPVYHSGDLVHWELITHILDRDHTPDLCRIKASKGIWAPCLSYCERDDLFYVVYGIMQSMNARYFDVDNYLITAKDIRGPWSKPVYLHSAGFDASLFHDDDGRKYLVSLEWETRLGYEQPGAICLVEYDPQGGKLLGVPKRIYSGGTDRGCIEGPHLYKRNGFYYLLCAEGGTGYYHSVTMARAKTPFGPYEADPHNPILSSSSVESNERGNTDHLKPQYYNPTAALQKAGHGSLVELPNGETYMAYLCARPLLPELCCPLGRETAIQKMNWTEDGWLKTASGSIYPENQLPEPDLPACPTPAVPERDSFDRDSLGLIYYSPRQLPASFAESNSRRGWLRISGAESQASVHHFHLIARKLMSLSAAAATCLDYDPTAYQHSAGLILYYDCMNNIFLRKTFSPRLGGSVLVITAIENGVRRDLCEELALPKACPIHMQLRLDGRYGQFAWGTDGKQFAPIGPAFELFRYSDEYCRYGEFTGAMVGMACVDSLFHRLAADFDYFELTLPKGTSTTKMEQEQQYGTEHQRHSLPHTWSSAFIPSRSADPDRAHWTEPPASCR